MSQTSPAPRGGEGGMRFQDEVPPPGGGVFRRFAPGQGSSLAAAFTALESVFAPAAKQARDEIQRRKKIGQKDPADTDPPAPDAAEPVVRVVSPGRPGTPYSGSIVLRARPPER
jgi:hypothetical protein